MNWWKRNKCWLWYGGHRPAWHYEEQAHVCKRCRQRIEQGELTGRWNRAAKQWEDER